MNNPKDYLGQEIEAGDIIAIAMVRGKSATLQQRFVREAHPTYLVTQPGPQEPEDKRQLGRITNFKNAIVIT